MSLKKDEKTKGSMNKEKLSDLGTKSTSEMIKFDPEEPEVKQPNLGSNPK